MDHLAWTSIDTMIFDVDGVFTDGTFQITESGELLRTFHARDMMALKMAIIHGYNVAIVTKGKSQGVKKIFQRMGVQRIYEDISNKIIPFEELVSEHGFVPNKTLYVGDDLPDLAILEKVRIPCCPNDATHEVINASNYVSPFNGGKGAVRNIIENVMRAKDQW